MLDSGSNFARAALMAVAAAPFVNFTPAIAADAAAQAVNAVPATDATWKSIDTRLQQLETLIAAGKLDDLGSSGYGVANLVKTLPGQSGSLPSDKLAQVKGSARVVGGYVTKVSQAGESKDKRGPRDWPGSSWRLIDTATVRAVGNPSKRHRQPFIWHRPSSSLL